MNRRGEVLFVWIMFQNFCVGVYKTEYGFLKIAFKLIIYHQCSVRTFDVVTRVASSNHT